MSWVQFVITSFVCISLLFIFVPCIRSLGFSFIASVALSPLTSIAVLCLAGVILDYVGLSVPAYVLAFLLLAVALISFTLSRLFHPHQSCSDLMFQHSECFYIALYVLIGLFVCTVFFILPLNGPDSFVQYSDNVAHLGRIQTMLDDGRYSILSTGNYSLNLSSSEVPVSSSRAFYPAGISVLAAVVSGITRASVTMSQNVILFVFMAIVLTTGFCYLFAQIFPCNKPCMIFGGFAVMMFAAFPFGLLLYGPLYPNVASMCCAPAVAAVFIELFKPGLRFPARFIHVILFLFASFALCALQPNTVFLLAVFLAPFCCHYIYSFIVNRYPNAKAVRLKAFFLAMLFAFFAVGVWTLCYLSPSFRAVVTFRWEHLYKIPYAIWSFATLALRRNLPEYVAAVLVLIGFVSACFDREKRWLSVAYVLMGIIYVVGISTEGPLKQYLAGFWYTDPYRTSASVALLAIPLAALGISVLFNLLIKLLRNEKPSYLVLAAVAVGIVIFVVNISFPNYGYPKRAFSEIYDELTYLNDSDSNKLLNYGEVKFLQNASKITGDDLVINNPYDGSVYAYPLSGMNVYFKSLNLNGETEQAISIGNRLNLYGSDPAVTEAVDDTGAGYILVLDELNYVPMGDTLLYSQYALYPFRNWTGFDSLPQDASRYTVVLDDGLHKLLRINR